MLKKFLPAAILSVALLFTACSQNKPSDEAINSRGYADFIGKKIGVGVDTICDQIAERYVKAIPVYYSDLSTGIKDIRDGKIDGYLTDLVVTKMLVSTPGNEDMEYVEVPARFFYAHMGAITTNPDIINSFNEFLDEIKADGTLKEMQDRWLRKMPDRDAEMPDIPLTGENGTFRVATDSTKIPFSFIDGKGEFAGYSIELAWRFAARKGMDVEIMDVSFGEMFKYVTSYKADFAIANISETEDRKKDVLFTDSIYDDQFSIISQRSDW